MYPIVLLILVPSLDQASRFRLLLTSPTLTQTNDEQRFHSTATFGRGHCTSHILDLTSGAIIH